jgi:lambda family phage portal protein
VGAVQILGADGMPLASTCREVGGKWASGLRASSTSAYAGASHDDPDLALWNPSEVSAQTALTFGRDTLARRVHDLARNDGWAAASVARQVDAIIGSGWRLASKPNYRRLGISAEQAEELAIEIESVWRDYADDFESCDAGQRLTMGGVLALNFRHYVQDGEALSLSLWLNDRDQDWFTAIQTIDPDRLSNPNLYFDSVDCRHGIRLGKYNEPLSFFIRSDHPGDYGVIGATPWIWDEIPRKYSNGRWCVVHAFEPKRAGQVRGEPPLAPVLKKLRMLGRYDEAELQAAVLNAVLAAFIKSPHDHEQIANAMNGKDDLSLVQDTRLGFYEKAGLRIPGARVNFLFPEDEVHFTNPTHPNANFEPFFRAGIRNIAAATGLSYEQLSMDWSQSNYSSARGALLEVWRGFTARKDNFAALFMQPHYINWLDEAFARGLIKVPKGAPKFREARQAYARARWIGPARGWVDPAKEAEAAIERISGGLSTYERECAEQGIDHIDLFDDRARERRQMKKRGLDPDALMRSRVPAGVRPGQDQPTDNEKKDEKDAA